MAMLKRILLAEDNDNDVELTLTALAENNLANEVVVVRDGAEAWDFLCHEGTFEGRNGGNPAVVLLDLKMPKVDGLELLRRMRQDSRFKNVPVVVLTSSREESDIVQSYRLGVNAFVVKPVAFEEFVEAVKNLGLFWAVLNEPPPDRLQSASPA
jgi:CheY-like chemotaxis protein